MPTLRINDKTATYDVPDDTPMLWVLRDLTGCRSERGVGPAYPSADAPVQTGDQTWLGAVAAVLQVAT